MQIKYFVWNEITSRFENVSESMFHKVRNDGVDGYINNTIAARKEGALWQFDVELGGVFGREIAELVRVVASLQGSFIVPAGFEPESGMGFGSSNAIDDAETRKAAILALTPPRSMGFGSHDDGSVEQEQDTDGFGIKE